MSSIIDPKDQSSILMVDDTPANLELLSGMLTGRGYKMRAAVSGELALQAVRSDPPDLILLDINMPGLNGFEVCARLKADKKYSEIPVIFLSALTETLDKVKAFGTGGVDYITKPFQLEEVEARVATHLELRRQKRRLQEAYDRLRELEGLRDTLVHMIINDLRSPLTGAYAYLKLARDNADKTLSVLHSGYIGEAMKALLQMIQMACDVLDASKLEQGQMELKTAEIDLGLVLEDCISGLKPLFKGREIRFSLPESAILIRADREVVRRIVQNLLSNALRFTSAGGVIRLGIQSGGDRVRVSVTDNGTGIAPEYSQKLFAKYAQAELRTANQRYSPGLGLPFCKLAVEAHGGRIGVESVEGKGSAFWFELPVDGPVPRPDAANPQP